MLLKKIVAFATTLIVIGVGVISYAAEINESTSCSVCKYEVLSGSLLDTPQTIYDPVLKYVKPSSNYVSYETTLIQYELRSVISNLEKEGVDSRSLFGGNTFNIYATDAFFDGYAAFTLWYGVNDERNGIVFGGRDISRDSESYKQNVAHEFAHLVFYYYFDSDFFKKYREAREIPDSWGDTWDTEWGKRPTEIFADDFAQLFGSKDYFLHRGEIGKLEGATLTKVKSLIVDAILSKQKFSQDTEDEEFLKKLREKRIVPYNDFLLCELPLYKEETITNKEFINWIQHLIDIKNPSLSFSDIFQLEKIRDDLSLRNTDDIASSESVISILNQYSGFLRVPNKKVWDETAFEKERVTAITKGEAGRIIYSYLS